MKVDEMKALIALCIIGTAVMITAAPAQKQSLADGERMYRQGILPSGGRMRVIMPGGSAPPGTAFACTSCHTRSGLGTMDSMQPVPSINGPNLFRPLYSYYPTLTEKEREELLPLRFQTSPRRPAYTDRTLIAAIRDGIDPGGRSLKPIMPRYALSDSEMTALIAYLKDLSSRPSPGVTETTMALATIVTDDVPPAERDAMQQAMGQAIAAHNNLGPGTGNMSRMLSMQVMGLGYRRLTLDRWTLTGSPETWRDQLEKYYEVAPVFALVGGISYRTWSPIHRFCEARAIPCILPITNLPELSKSDFYTLYFTKGFYQEGEAVARYLSQSIGRSVPREIVQVLGAGPEARALADGFRDAWAGVSRSPIRSVSVSAESPLTGESIARLVPNAKDSALLLWSGPEAFDVLRSIASAGRRPATVFMSSTLLGDRLLDLPSEARSFTYVAYPFGEPGPRTVPGKMGGAPLVVKREYRNAERRIVARTETLMALFMRVLTQMERNYFRDHLLDLIDMMSADDRSDYELLNYGPGVRYLSDGCLIVRVSDGPAPALIRVGDGVQ